MKPNPDKIKSHLGELGALSAQTQKMEQKILTSAQKRLSVVEKSIDPARIAAQSGAAEAEEKYQSLILERGQLHIVISKAKHILAATSA
jgi:hypothetical protein